VSEKQVKVRKAPRYRSLVITGIFVGIVVAGIIAFSIPSSLETAPLGQGITQAQAFGYLVVIFGTAGLAVASIIYLIMDRISNRRIKEATAEVSEEFEPETKGK